MKSIFRRFGLPHVVAVLAVALVLGSGTAYAAKQITSKNIKNNTIKSIDVKDGALTGTDIADGTIASADVATDTLTAADLAPNSVASLRDPRQHHHVPHDVAADTLTAADLASQLGRLDRDRTPTASAATEIEDNSIDSGEIVDVRPEQPDLGVLFAQVSVRREPWTQAAAASAGGVSVDLPRRRVGTYWRQRRVHHHHLLFVGSLRAGRATAPRVAR